MSRCGGSVVIELDVATSGAIRLHLGEPGEHRLLAIEPTPIACDRHVVVSRRWRGAHSGNELVVGGWEGVPSQASRVRDQRAIGHLRRFGVRPYSESPWHLDRLWAVDPPPGGRNRLTIMGSASMQGKVTVAESEAKKTTYPKMPASNWWDLRRRFQHSPPKSIGVDYLLSALGLTSEGAAANLLSPLRTVGLIDDNNSVTQRAHAWRDDDSYAEVCRQIIEDVYPATLVELFPPPQPDLDGVRRWFARNAGVGDAAANKMAAFYRLLSEADPAGGDRPPQKQPAGGTAKKRATPARASKASKKASEKSADASSNGAAALAATSTANTAPTHQPNVRLNPMGAITVNIELQIPATADAKFFDQFFSSMRKHLIDENE